MPLGELQEVPGSAGRAVEGSGEVLERFGSSMGGESTAGRAPGRAPETHYIEISLSFPFELEIRQNVS